MKEEASPELEAAAAATARPGACTGCRSGSWAAACKMLKAAGVTHAVMAGQVKHTKIFGGDART